MADKVKPCPFCGGEGRLDGSSHSTLSWPLWNHDTMCPLNAAKMYQNREEALFYANRRFDVEEGA